MPEYIKYVAKFNGTTYVVIIEASSGETAVAYDESPLTEMEAVQKAATYNTMYHLTKALNTIEEIESNPTAYKEVKERLDLLNTRLQKVIEYGR